ncbi:MAG: SDR family NAD(P)-dependent oxidoreductase [Burkholderiaceae bacterium]|jgi:NAD(P)-dependent dehydrogenase (short-subunit alcohol dehydrogenase family)
MHSLRDGYQVALFGASGGLGAALLRAFIEDPCCGRIHAGARHALVLDSTKVSPFTFDLQHEDSIAQAAEQIQHASNTVDLTLVATGVLHGQHLQPEKTYRSLNGDALAHWFELNTIGPALIAKHMLPMLPTATRGVFAAVSAKVGSISDNRLGGWHGYRASKAALNMLIKTFALEVSRRHPLALCVALHPGTVDTPLSKPFQSAVKPGQLTHPDDAARHLLGVLDQAPVEQSGSLLAWNGAVITP